ncbi:MAG: SRPBCC family protein [Betaproteobacteria bacterium]
MAKVKMETKVPVSADALWQTVGGFNALPKWHPAVASSEATGDAKGSTRTLSLAGGGKLVERLEDADPKRRSYRYSIVAGPLPVADYTAEVHVIDNGDGTSTLEWSSDFEPKGASEQDALGVVRGIYQAGFDNLRKMFGA